MLVCLAGCGGDTGDAPPETSERTQPLSRIGVERVVPVRFVALPAPGVAVNGEWTDMVGSIQVTNQAFRNAGVQFEIAAVDRFTEANLPFISAIVCVGGSLPTCFGGQFLPRYSSQAPVQWQSIRADLTVLFPAIGAAAPGGLPPNTATATTQQWLYYAGSRFAPREQLVTFVPPSGGLFGTFPHEGRIVAADAGALGDWWKYAHEMGHVFGISHCDGQGNPDDTGNSRVCIPSGGAACDIASGAGLGTMPDFWDMIYLPGSSVTDRHRVFSSRAQAAGVDVSKLRWIDDGKKDGQGNRCTVDSFLANPTGRMRCTLPGVGAYSETWDTDDVATAGKLRGYMWPAGGGYQGKAMMSYRLEPERDDRAAHAGFSDSQANLIRLTLRYDQPSDSNTPVGTLLKAAGVSAGRPFLGRALRRRPHDLVDFDDDGFQDIAMWSPPTTATGVGIFRTFGSRNGPNGPFGTQTEVAFGALGDTPVVADYNGDGITDFAVYHDTGGGNGAAREWRWCISTRGAYTGGTPAYAEPTHNCTSPGVYLYGIRGDVPIPGTRVYPSSGAEMTVYRPDDGILFVYSSSMGHQPKNLGLSAAERGQTPYVANFDTHGGHDIGFYDPQNAKFSLWLSSSAWGARIDRSFCPGGLPCAYVPAYSGTSASRAGAVPVWGIASQKTFGLGIMSVGALGLWDPSNGTWNVMWDPTASATIETHQWGYFSDMVVPGAVGLKRADAPVSAGTRSELVVFRPSDTGQGAFLRCAFPSSAASCPAPAYPAGVAVGEFRSEVFAVADMKGDGKPELCAFDPQLQVVRCLTSDTGYAYGSVITVTFVNPTSPFAIVGGQLL